MIKSSGRFVCLKSEKRAEAISEVPVTSKFLNKKEKNPHGLHVCVGLLKEHTITISRKALTLLKEIRSRSIGEKDQSNDVHWIFMSSNVVK